jgi:hypothetical protein
MVSLSVWTSSRLLTWRIVWAFTAVAYTMAEPWENQMAP